MCLSTEKRLIVGLIADPSLSGGRSLERTSPAFIPLYFSEENEGTF
jgi:hypothetical protein